MRFDYDALREVMETWEPLTNPRMPEAVSNNYFEHCAQLAATVFDKNNAHSYAENLAWSSGAHFKDAAFLMCEAAKNFERGNTSDGSYDGVIDKCYKYATAFEQLSMQISEIAEQLKQDFCS